MSQTSRSNFGTANIREVIQRTARCAALRLAFSTVALRLRSFCLCQNGDGERRRESPFDLAETIQGLARRLALPSNHTFVLHPDSCVLDDEK